MDQLLYAEFGPDNGSILLNLSEQGCSFQSIAPVRAERVRFSVSVGDGRKLEGDGQMVWSDAAKKTGGVRFLNPSWELREQVRAWLNQTLVTTDGKLDPTAMQSEAKRRRKKLREEARVEAERARRGDPLPGNRTEALREDSGLKEEGRPFNNATVEQTVTPSAEGSTSQAADSNSGARWRGIGSIALGLVLFMTMVTYRRELGHLMISFGSNIAGDEKKAGSATPLQAPPAPESSTPDVKPAAMPDTRETSNEGSGGTAGTDSGEMTRVAELAIAPAKRGPAKHEGGGEDVTSLWTSVESGDTRAEVVLANRYIQGQGVPQSCEQARVLLEAAVKRGSSEAKQRLGDIGQAGCP